MSLRSLFIDFDSFFASVEQQESPELRGRPVGVVPVMADTTCCIAASYEAKAFGVRTGTKVAEAKRLCPDIALIQARHGLYRVVAGTAARRHGRPRAPPAAAESRLALALARLSGRRSGS